MKRFLCVCLIALLALTPFANAEKATFKTDKFYVKLQSDWVEIDNEEGSETKKYGRVTDDKYDLKRGYMVIMQVTQAGIAKNSTKAAIDKYLTSYITLFELTGMLQLIGYDEISVSGKKRTVALIQMPDFGDELEDMYVTIVPGNGAYLLIIYGNSSLQNPKTELIEIIESVVVR